MIFYMIYIVIFSYVRWLHKQVLKQLGTAALKQEERGWEKGQKNEEEKTSKGVRVHLFIAPFALSFGFIHSSFSVASWSFVLWRPARAEKGWKGGDEGLKGRQEGAALLNQIARNKICILLRAIPEREFPSRPWKTPVCHCGRGSNFPISFRDMDTTSPFDPPVGFHGEPTSRIKILTRVWSFKYSSILTIRTFKKIHVLRKMSQIYFRFIYIF